MLSFEDLPDLAQSFLEKESKKQDVIVTRTKNWGWDCNYINSNEDAQSFSMESGEAILTEEGKRMFTTEDYIIVPKGTFDKTKYKRKPNV